MADQNLYDKLLSNKNAQFLISQMLETGLPPELNHFPAMKEGRTFQMHYMNADDKGDVRFYVPDILTGDCETYLIGEPPHQKVRDWYLTRHREPKQTKDGPAKYTPAIGGGTRVLITPPVFSAYGQKRQIKTLFLVEGFKKAIAAYAANGLPIIGMNGLTGFKEPGDENNRLRKEIKEVLTVCQVKKVVVILDSDLFDLSGNYSKPGEIATKRPNNFFRATLLAKTLFEPFADVFLTHPHRSPEGKFGLDDLLLKHRNISPIRSELPGMKKEKADRQEVDGQKRVLADLERVVERNMKGDYFDVYKLSAMSDYTIKKIFHIDNVQSFYDYFRPELQQTPHKKFNYFTYTYQINADGTISQTEDQNQSHLNIEVRMGRLVRRTDKGIKELANFTMEVLFQIDSENDPKRICKITNYEHVIRIIEVSSKTFVSLSDFQALMITYGDFIFKGTKEDLLDLMTILFKHEKPAIQVETLGWQPIERFFAFSNGIVGPNGFIPVDEYGMLSYNDQNYYFPAWSKFNSRDYESFREVKKFAHIRPTKPTTFIAWKRQFSKVYGKNGEIAVPFFIASLFSDFVFAHKSGNGFPLLWAAGKPQTGKSTICESLLYLYGDPSETIGLAGKSTIKYFMTRFAQVRNSVVHLDEYSNTKVSKDVKETLKQLYDRVGYGRKSFSNDNRTQSTNILSSAMVSGEEIPTDNHALFTRSILMLFNKDKYTPEERNEMKRLRQMEENGLTTITVNLLQHRQVIEDRYDETYDQVFQEFHNKFRSRNVQDRMLKNAARVLTILKVLLDTEKIEYNLTFNEVLAVYFDNIERQNTYIQSNTDISKFWDIVENLYSRGEISEKRGDFRFVDDLIAIRLNRFHHLYSIEARKLGYEKILDKSTLQNYLINEPYHREMTGTNGKPKQVRFAGTNGLPALFFMYEDLRIDLKGNPADDAANGDYLVEEEDKIQEQQPVVIAGQPLSSEEKNRLPF